MKSYLIFFAIVAAVATVSATDYCDMSCFIDGTEIKHLGCDNDKKLSAACPPDFEVLDMDRYFQQVIVNATNKIRNFVAGGANSSFSYKPACRMATIKWHDGLAEVVDFDVRRCSKEKHLCNWANEHYKYGQIISREKRVEWNRPAGLVLEEIISEFFDDINEKTHFGDLLADRNIRLGCAATSLQTEDLYKIYQLTCNVATEITDRESMYDTCESAAERCESGTNPDFPNLCSEAEVYELY